jgi:MYXO-CTERM domain-containing protein
MRRALQAASGCSARTGAPQRIPVFKDTLLGLLGLLGLFGRGRAAAKQAPAGRSTGGPRTGAAATICVHTWGGRESGASPTRTRVPNSRIVIHAFAALHTLHKPPTHTYTKSVVTPHWAQTGSCQAYPTLPPPPFPTASFLATTSALVKRTE